MNKQVKQNLEVIASISVAAPKPKKPAPRQLDSGAETALMDKVAKVIDAIAECYSDLEDVNSKLTSSKGGTNLRITSLASEVKKILKALEVAAPAMDKATEICES